MKPIFVAILAFGACAVSPCIVRAKAESPSLNVIPSPKSVVYKSSKPVAPKDTALHLTVDPAYAARLGEEGYILEIGKNGINAKAAGEKGAVWARNTLNQIKDGSGKYPFVTIEDRPEFPVRGFMYDCGRNWVPIGILEGYIDLMSRYKLNVFHWHLTDKPAWRIESKAYPRLNDGKFMRQGRDQGKFYTYGEIRGLIKYAKKRGIDVIPEIDIPGHSDYFRTVFGTGMDSKEGMEVLETLFDEFCSEIPAELCLVIHIGSDEVHISDKKGFMDWAQSTVRKHGRKAMVWDPGLPADSATIRQVWRGGMAEEGFSAGDYPVVDSSMGYLNIYDPMLLPYKLYFHNTCGSGLAYGNNLGGILCLWNDVKACDKSKISPHSGMAGGIMAFSENLWKGGVARKENHGPAETIWASADGPDAKCFGEFQQRMLAQRKTFGNDDFNYWQPVKPVKWELSINNDSITKNAEAFGEVLDLDAIAAELGFRPEEKLRCRLSRTINSPSDTTLKYLIGFDNPARSDRMADGIPSSGKWENNARILVNGIELEGPEYVEPDCYRYHYHTWARPEEELPYTDEQLYWMRSPVEVSLKQGDNSLTIDIPRHYPGQHWQASFVEVVE